MAQIAFPLLAHIPALGDALRDAFAWVDAHLRDI
jgi:hypothetical protein